jgi:hypothetical protein
MNRRSFFKFLGIGAATAAVAPKLLVETQLDRDERELMRLCKIWQYYYHLGDHKNEEEALYHLGIFEYRLRKKR